MKTDYTVKSLVKAMKILELFSEEHTELGITEIGNALGLNKSNVHNIISTFEKIGYIRSTKSGKYTLGLKLLEYAFIINKYLGFQSAIYDILFALSNKLDEVVHFGIPWNTNVLYLLVIHPISKLPQMAYRNTTGLVAPLYSTGIGKAILASLSEEKWSELITKDRIQYTENTFVQYDDIIDELRKTKARGFSLDNMEKDSGIKCVGMAVYNISSNLVGGVSISGPEASMSDDKILECVDELAIATKQMKERLYF